jgi:hypothetical protein
MSAIEARLRELGIELPPPKAPVANYLGCKRGGELLFVSGRVSQLRGEVGSDVTAAAAREAARSTLVDILAIVNRRPRPDRLGGEAQRLRALGPDVPGARPRGPLVPRRRLAPRRHRQSTFRAVARNVS